MPLYAAVAWAAEPRMRNADFGMRSETQKTATTGERFEKALETIREKIDKAQEKTAKNQDATAEVAEVKAKRTDIEKIDIELRKEFSATEKKLKDAKLPKEILDRHYKFVKHYEDNLAELKANLTGIEQSAKGIAFKKAIQKTKAHLEKTKPPTKHVPLDPNKLPFRTVKAKERAPRLKKEEFKKDFPTQKAPAGLRSADFGLRNVATAGFSLREKASRQKPFLVASNGSLAGLLPSNPELGTRNSLSDYLSATSTPSAVNAVAPHFELGTSNYQLALATSDLPTSDDLAETPEVQFTDDIKAKAAELGYSPVKIYEWVRNNVEFVPTCGSIQGADMCLQTKQCNAFDTASLLIALLRVSGISARYVYGTVEIPIDKVMNWGGGFSDSTSALNFIASGGIPATGLRSGGTTYAARIEHVWVKAFVDYIPSMGAVHKQGDTWIPLDASYKQYTYTEGVDFQSTVPFDGQSLIDQIKATATINKQESYVTNVSSTVVENALTDYNTQLETYVTDNLPDATPGDILGKKEIIKKEQPILPASLPYKVTVAGVEATEVPDSLRHKVTIQLANADYSSDTAFSYTTGLPQLAGKRVTVSYDPATDADQAIIAKYVEQYATSIPAYLVQFKPSLKIEGTTVATGAAVGMGNAQNLTISLSSINSMEMITHDLVAGDYSAIGINPSTISSDALQKRVDKNDFSEPVGEMLHQTALSYWAEVDAFNNVISKTLHVNNLRHPSELSAAAKVSVSYIWGVPTSATYKSRTLDVKLDNQSVATKATDKTKEFYYMLQSGTNSSFLEGAIYDQLFGGNIGDGITAITALKLANEQGIPIYKIDSNNVATVLPKLQVSDDVKTEVSNAVNAGLQVQIPQTNITKSDWTGVGYIILNMTDGTGAYRISGGLNGDVSSTGGSTVMPLPQVPLNGPVSFVLVGLSANVGTLTATTDAGILIGIKIAPELIAAGVLLVLMGIMFLIWAVLKTIVDRYQPKPRWEPYRHYTSVSTLQLILASNSFKVGEIDGTYGYGVYLTRITDQPDATIDSQGLITYGPICYLIQAKLGLSSIEKTAAYLDVLIDMNRRGVLPKKPPEEYLLIGWPGEMMPFGKDILVEGFWLPTPTTP